MGNTVEIYLKFVGDLGKLAAKIATIAGSRSYHAGPDSVFMAADLSHITGGEGRVECLLTPTDLGETGDPGMYADTAYAPYEYELSIELRGGPVSERQSQWLKAGETLFMRMTALQCPLAYGSDDIFADFLPARGVREFAPGTSSEAAGRDSWFEPALHDISASSPVNLALADHAKRPGRGRIYACEDSLFLLPELPGSSDSEPVVVAPIAQLKESAVSAAFIGGQVQAMLARAAEADISNSFQEAGRLLLDLTHKTANEFSRAAICLRVSSTGGQLDVAGNEPITGDDDVDQIRCGKKLDGLKYSGVMPTEVELGALISDLLESIRSKSATPDQ